MTDFKELRLYEWKPQFTWVQRLKTVADMINRPHEDYPYYVHSTYVVLETLLEEKSLVALKKKSSITTKLLLMIHRNIFSGIEFAGKTRQVDVVVGNHVPPKWQEIERHLERLEKYQSCCNIPILEDWYYGFETIHPFQYGNGRVGGVVVAVISNLLEPDNGYLTAL